MLNPLFYQLYLLQLENYDLRRYFALLSERGFYFPGSKLRKSITWTLKAKGIFAISVVTVIIVFFIILTSSAIASVFWLLLSLLFMPVIYSLVVIAIFPFDYYAKHSIIAKARDIVKSRDVKIIGIAGSYGKTSMKNVIATIISSKLKVISTPESINTPVGISRWIINNLTRDTQVMIVEMGEHYRGDVSFLSSITPSDFAVITGVNEAHLERLRNLEQSIATIFEIAEDSRKGSLIVLNSDDEKVRNNYKSFTKGRNLYFYTKSKNELAENYVENAKFDEAKLAWGFDIGDLDGLSIPILGEYAIGNVMAGIKIARELGMDDEQIKSGIANIKPVEHRLQPIKGHNNVLVIDDSYNGNPDGASEAIKTLSRFTGRKIYLTPGLVEMGAKSKEVHIKIGHELAKVANQIMLIKNSVTPFIAEGLKAEKFPESDIIWFDSAEIAHKSLGKYLKENDVILFQNDWGDEYI